MFQWVKDLFTSPAQRRAERASLLAQLYVTTERYKAIAAKYDAAQTNDDNRRHWANADALSARAANDPDTRKTLRERSRYECTQSNCHARGITMTLANDLVGTGARLQCLYPDEILCDAIETAWEAWANEIHLAEKLYTFALATVVDGEAFAVLTTNDTLSSVRLDVRVIECEMVTTPQGAKETPVDGIEFDKHGNPSHYTILREHPGDNGQFNFGASPAFDRAQARDVLHWFRPDRPMQARGVPELTPALPIFSQLRRYTLAVLAAAEIAADFAMFIHTEMQPTGDDIIPTPFTGVEIDKGLISALPKGYKPFQLNPTQPSATHETFTKTLLREACHAANVPYNIATADFSEDSYAGGRMALGVYQRTIEVRRKHFMSRVLDRIFAAWLKEAMLLEIFKVPKKLLQKTEAGLMPSIPHTWFFDEWVHVDPLKEANATQVELLIGTTTLAAELAKKGVDWRKSIAQMTAEYELRRKGNCLVLPPGTPPLDGTPQGVGAPAAAASTTTKAEDDSTVDTVIEDAGVMAS